MFALEQIRILDIGKRYWYKMAIILGSDLTMTIGMTSGLILDSKCLLYNNSHSTVD